ncbi:hypothetical protein [Bythopirellula goksoeyrii]|uniref:Phosphate-selective porin O and P n=1 Tax=Bythopirellula goksoeyrii TaxID=1400387 RepID=A0A5B9QQT6_9BACT|nr:hypothetical protein [Bythopirellula goksoeyrii]QEG36491.1 hypothetical protein Pr1d_38050 [Bythopirellula goksoeyrii]
MKPRVLWLQVIATLCFGQPTQSETLGELWELPAPENSVSLIDVAYESTDTSATSITNEDVEFVNYDEIYTKSDVGHTWSEKSYFPFGDLHRTCPKAGPCGNSTYLEYGLVARGLYSNDQRIQWSGVETTFVGEGAAYVNYHVDSGNWETSVECEVYLNQPTDRNIFLNTPERESYAANYDFRPFELSRLNVAVRNGDWEVRAGRMWTPFGRYYSQLWTNQLIDAPFIRTEAILWRETGLLLRWDPGIWVIDAGLFNGHHGRDANSTKGLVARIGAEEENWALGSSVKVQDGFGSENQKTYNNHVGLDAMVRQGRWRLFSEVLWDEYGLRRDDFDPLDIFWEKSIYFRDINKADGVPIQGTGYYVALDYSGPLWTLSLSFGQYFPEDIGNVKHDRTQNRGVVKLARSFGENLQAYSVFMKENDGYLAQQDRPRIGTVLISGLQFNF